MATYLVFEVKNKANKFVIHFPSGDRQALDAYLRSEMNAGLPFYDAIELPLNPAQHPDPLIICRHTPTMGKKSDTTGEGDEESIEVESTFDDSMPDF